MRIAFLTTSRFWLVDLARELHSLGHETRVYSLVPPAITKRYGLPLESNRWLLPLMPAYALTRAAAKTRLASIAQTLLDSAVDAVAANRIEPCDALVAMSGIGLRSLDAVRRRHGAKIFLERASQHVLSQRAILEAIPGIGEPISATGVIRELSGYALADVVTIPSLHVEQSFLDHGYPKERLFRNPLGASLEHFQATAAPPAEPKTVLITGAWSLRKGCDVLVRAMGLLRGVKLLHVGPVVDAPLPDAPWFEHVDAVPQSELPAFYARAHAFVLPSREDGFGMVLTQALACGVPIVCTSRTGGPDLREWTTSPDAVEVVPSEDAAQLAAALERALANQPPPGQLRDLLGPHREELSWTAYAKRYEKRLAAAIGLAAPDQPRSTARSFSTT